MVIITKMNTTSSSPDLLEYVHDTINKWLNVLVLFPLSTLIEIEEE
jgi:hypothetical protein